MNPDRGSRRIKKFFSGCSQMGVFQQPERKAEAGFTLLEVLVSLSLLGIAVTVIFQLYSANLRSIAVSEDYVAATLEAQSQMREIVTGEEIAEKSWSGFTANGYRYEVSIAEALSERAENLSIILVEIELRLFWTKGKKEKTLVVKTLKMIPRPV